MNGLLLGMTIFGESNILRWFHNHKLAKDRKEETFSVKANLISKLRIPEKHNTFLRQITHRLY
jgi:hypothetical protein